MAKNSAFKNKNKIAELINAKIKYSTQYTGFLDVITPIDDKITKNENV